MSVYFIDTSVFCNILPVPGRDQDRAAVLTELTRRQELGTLILPVTTIIETGNFIAQLPTGGERRATALRLVMVLRMVCEGRAPWALHEFAWERSLIEDLIEGSGTKVTLVEHAESKVGAGDLAILAEVRAYAKRASPTDVKVWSLDSGLMSFS